MSVEPCFDEPFLKRAAEAISTGTGRGVRVAVLDSGIDTSHPAMNGVQLSDDITFQWEGQMLRSIPGGGDSMGHGTGVAHVIRHIAPDVELGSFRVLNADMKSRTTVVWEAAKMAMQRGYHILNCSFGCAADSRFVMPYKEWIDEAYLRGVHVVAACNNDDVQSREWPGWFTSVITVNLAKMEEDRWARRQHSLVDFAAHGFEVNVPWRDGGWRVVTGSSFAAPRVTGWLARLLSIFPELRVDEAKALLWRLGKE